LAWPEIFADHFTGPSAYAPPKVPTSSNSPTSSAAHATLPKMFDLFCSKIFEHHKQIASLSGERTGAR